MLKLNSLRMYPNFNSTISFACENIRLLIMLPMKGLLYTFFPYSIIVTNRSQLLLEINWCWSCFFKSRCDYSYNPRYNCTIERNVAVWDIERWYHIVKLFPQTHRPLLERVVHYYPPNFKLSSRLSGHHPFWSILIPTNK